MPITTTPSNGPQGEFSTYTPIYAQTLSSASASVTFSNIPTTYTDLVLVSSNVTCSTAGGFISLRFNSDSSSIYSNTYLTGSGTSATSGRNAGSVIYIIGDTDTTNTTVGVTHIMNYSNALTFKNVLSRCGYAAASTQALTSTWRSTSPVTSITLYGNGNINSGSTFTLYGIKAAATAPKATGGDQVYTDGTYWYHKFLNSGVLDVKTALTADYLIVAGGGGAGRGGGNNRGGGGGGAGGYRTFSSQALVASTYTVTVGAGGAGVSSSEQTGKAANGSNSQFSTNSASGGGGAGAAQDTAINSTGAAGGSGGGATANNSPYNGTGGAGNLGSYSPVEGYAGGATDGSNSGNNLHGGGGGGSSSVGGAGLGGTANPGAGGSGTSNSISGTSVTYAAGGTGGRGNGSSNGANGTTNLGNGGVGGSGSASSYTGGSGGSGIVIVRYAV